MNAKIVAFVCVICLCTIQPVRAEDIERPEESRPQVDTYVPNTSSEIKVEGYISGPPLKLEIKEKVPAQIKLEVIEERKESAADRAELQETQKVERIQPYVEKYRKQSTTLNDTYRQELKEAIRNGNKEEISQIRQEYMEKRKELNRQIVEQSKRRTLTETQKQKESMERNKNAPNDPTLKVQKWQRNIANKLQMLWTSLFGQSKN